MSVAVPVEFQLRREPANTLAAVAVAAEMGCTAEVIRTGLAFEVPAGYVMLIYSRSSHGFKNGVRLSNSVGVIDSDYRGEIKVALHNDSRAKFKVANGERIAQLVIAPVAMLEAMEVAVLEATERGTSGFGSTGR